MIFQSGECQICCRKKSSNVAKIWVKIEQNLSIFTIILMVTFGTKNVHCDGFLYNNNITFQIHCKRLVFPTKADLRQQLWCQLYKLIPSDLKKMPKRLYLLPPSLLSFILRLWHHLQLSHSESKYFFNIAMHITDT